MKVLNEFFLRKFQVLFFVKKNRSQARKPFVVPRIIQFSNKKSSIALPIRKDITNSIPIIYCIKKCWIRESRALFLPQLFPTKKYLEFWSSFPQMRMISIP